MPGSLAGATYQPFSNRSLVMRMLRQSERDFGNQADARRRGVHLPNIPFYRILIGNNGITHRLAKQDSLRITEMLREYEVNPEEVCWPSGAHKIACQKNYRAFVRGVSHNVPRDVSNGSLHVSMVCMR